MVSIDFFELGWLQDGVIDEGDDGGRRDRHAVMHQGDCAACHGGVVTGDPADRLR